jgi:hypothetical protein
LDKQNFDLKKKMYYNVNIFVTGNVDNFEEVKKPILPLIQNKITDEYLSSMEEVKKTKK